MVEDLLALHDKTLLDHFVRCKITSQVRADNRKNWNLIIAGVRMAYGPILVLGCLRSIGVVESLGPCARQPTILHVLRRRGLPETLPNASNVHSKTG